MASFIKRSLNLIFQFILALTLVLALEQGRNAYQNQQIDSAYVEMFVLNIRIKGSVETKVKPFEYSKRPNMFMTNIFIKGSVEP